MEQCTTMRDAANRVGHVRRLDGTVIALALYQIDVLTARSHRALGIIVDDRAENLSTEIRLEKVRHRREEGVVVEIEEDA